MRAVLIFVVLATILFFIGVAIAHDERGVIRTDLALAWTRRVVGVVIVGISAFGLLLLALAGDSLKRQADLALPLLGGIVLLDADWRGLLAFAVVGTALIVKETLGPPSFPRKESTRETDFRA
jgi:hypothetical protein